MNWLILWVAQGFGVGRIPYASGTLGSLVCLLWFAALLALGNYWLFLAGAALGIGLSIWLCGVAEKILQQIDPPSVVLDEIIALPLCFVGWVSILFWRDGQLATVNFFFARQNGWLTLGIFAAFRFFDIVKPWPVRQSQVLHGGWGVTTDDVLAAVYVNLGVLAIHALRG